MDCLSVFKYPNSHHSLGYFLAITELDPKSSGNNDLSAISTSTNCMDLWLLSDIDGLLPSYNQTYLLLDVDQNHIIDFLQLPESKTLTATKYKVI